LQALVARNEQASGLATKCGFQMLLRNIHAGFEAKMPQNPHQICVLVF
jgi:hypothetical protein